MANKYEKENLSNLQMRNLLLDIINQGSDDFETTLSKNKPLDVFYELGDLGYILDGGDIDLDVDRLDSYYKHKSDGSAIGVVIHPIAFTIGIYLISPRRSNKMTAGSLIELLSELPKDTEILIEDSDGRSSHTLENSDFYNISADGENRVMLTVYQEGK